VIAVNDLPTTSGFSASVNEDATLMFTAQNFIDVFSDIDVGDTLKSVKILTLPTTSQGVLKAKVGSASTVANVQADDTVLAANLNTLTFEPVANFNGTANFTFKVIDSSDGESVSAATVTITLNAVNDLPTASNIEKSVDEDMTLTFAESDFTGVYSDVENDALKSVKIVTLLNTENWKLTVGTTDPPTDVQAGDTVVAANLDSLKFVPAANWNGTATFTFKVIDSEDGESVAAATVTITVDSVNDLPTASNFSKSVNEDTTVTFTAGNFTVAFSDVEDEAPKSVKIVTLPDSTHGVLKAKVGSATTVTDVQAGNTIVAANLNTLTFEPVADWNGTASFTFKVIDSSDGESVAAATVTITVIAVDDPPITSNISKTVNEDTTVTFAASDFSDVFSDVDGHTLKSVKIVSLPDEMHGVLKAKVGSASTVTNVQTNDTILFANLGTLTFEPVANINGTASFTFKVIDSSDGESVSAATVTITLNAVNDLPTASNIEKSVDEDMTLTFAESDFTGVYSDVENDALKSVKIVTLLNTENWKLTVGTTDPPTDVQAGDTVVAANLDSLKFVPAANWNGTATFTFKVIDSEDGESVAAATVTITVDSVNDLPTASNFSKSVNEDTTVTFTAGNFTVAFSDVEDEAPKSVKIVTLPDSTHGVLKAKVGSATTVTDVQAGNTIVAANLNTLTFEPVADWNGTASFTFKVIDSSDGESVAAATVTITVNEVNDLPTASNLSKSVVENTILTFAAGDFTGVFSDADGHTLKSVTIVSLPNTAHGTLKIGAQEASAGETVALASLGTLTFEPVANYTGSASFTFKVTDTSDSQSAAAATVTITVSETALPTASNISKSVNEDATLTLVAKDFNDAFSDGDGHTLKSVTIVTLPATSQGVLKAKVGSASTVTNVQTNDTVLAANLGTLTFEPVANFNGTVTFTFKVTDSSDAESVAAATVTITVNAVNDLPTASNFTKSVNEDTTLTFIADNFKAAFNDVEDEAPKSVKIVAVPDATHGTLKAKVGSATTVTDVQAGNTIVAANLNTLTFEPVANWNGTATFTFKVIDSKDGESAAAATVTITVNAVDDLPTASNISKSAIENTTLTFAAGDFTGAFNDADGHTLKSVSIESLPDTTHGVLKAKVGSATTVTNVVAGNTVVAANLGTLTFEPAANYTGAAS
ncbi:MAG: tandem-95 repeat protein, partial [Gammaproteobacteria bacterium]|nr:tandem-95 repeat protein [Gammaproteobacteria bacterium]